MTIDDADFWTMSLCLIISGIELSNQIHHLIESCVSFGSTCVEEREQK
jgi:hypothetical protein